MESPEVEMSDSPLSGNLGRTRMALVRELLGEFKGMKVDNGRLHSFMRR
jgi:hypothetical protein